MQKIKKKFKKKVPLVWVVTIGGLSMLWCTTINNKSIFTNKNKQKHAKTLIFKHGAHSRTTYCRSLPILVHRVVGITRGTYLFADRGRKVHHFISSSLLFSSKKIKNLTFSISILQGITITRLFLVAFIITP